ncbi:MULTISPECIES: acetyl-CoA carboxylase biotin carboxyl carrier protein [unclassified Corynebacterium]|uniref:acetyl-CoA carboxylase biotin carboxyl carrier protein n=1 Tax=Corynebacterium TaxID=1716 RepID=UPI00254E188E|nr:MULTISPECIES: acetyl-CoA carboxylase biotin carboxyl carrier protein [unclassified Corynebacterium]MDK8452309.1 acetyl-CoA carboxylase biotin carboxyl carrier protein [Corynebacterium sp. MSK084]MDK8476071.1 acetyl-CoA carboxylase biotin carboxyl carrier protein [Corynebacterium sp. MSK310]MDK8490956.1 acetyl-CoA carboxylase biotin carboxyl carrier protein [Corynebacterium sp. MSK175]MDK8514368.1 acetyl-CoA carboxylase biotin carboxyl carrier protein [Corynebacterium sp. MSK123]MDK8547522.1
MTDSTNLHDLKSLLKWANLSDDIQELQIKYGDVELAMSRTPGGLNRPAPVPEAAPAAAPAATPAQEAAPASAPAAEPESKPASAQEEAPKEEPQASGSGEPSAEGETVKAPMVGTFYAAPKPGADPFVKVGDEVEVGQVLCIVEVMKLMNNIESKVAGTVKEILVDNEDAVEHGQPIMVIQPK